MQIGTIIRFQDCRWQVVASDEPTYQAVAWNGSSVELTDGDPDVEIAAHPPTEWPFLAAPRRLRDGPIVKVRRTVDGQAQELPPLVDWALTSRLSSGGSIFFNPRLRLRQGEILVAEHRSGYLSRLRVTRGFGTVSGRKRRAEQPLRTHGRRTAYDRLLNNDDDFEELG